MYCFDSYIAMSVSTTRLRAGLQICQGYNIILFNHKCFHCVNWLCQALFSAAVNGNYRDTMPSNWPSCVMVPGRKPSLKWPVTHDWTQMDGSTGHSRWIYHIFTRIGIHDQPMIVISSGSVIITIVGWEQRIRPCIGDIAEAWICYFIHRLNPWSSIIQCSQKQNTTSG